MNIRMKVVLALVFSFLAAPSLAVARERPIEASELGDKWPLKVEKGTIGCRSVYGADSPYFVDPSGNRYGLTGHARTHMKLREIDPIWKDNKKLGIGKINITALTDSAMKLCK